MKPRFKSIGILIAAFLTILFSFDFLSINSSAKALIESEGLKFIEQENGDMVLYTGWTKKSDKRFYYKNGKMIKNKWLTSKGVRKYYLTDDGSAATGKVTISGTEYEFDDKGRLVLDKWNVKMETTDVSETGLTLVVTISDDSFKGEYTYGVPYTIEKYSENIWQPLTVINDDISWVDIELMFDVGINKYTYRWEDLYGQLPKGRYRICKEIRKYTGGECEDKVYYAYFTIA